MREPPALERACVLDEEEREHQREHPAGEHLEDGARPFDHPAGRPRGDAVHPVAEILAVLAHVLALELERTVDQPVLDVVPGLGQRGPEVPELVDDRGHDRRDHADDDQQRADEHHCGRERGGDAPAFEPPGRGCERGRDQQRDEDRQHHQLQAAEHEQHARPAPRAPRAPARRGRTRCAASRSAGPARQARSSVIHTPLPRVRPRWSTGRVRSATGSDARQCAPHGAAPRGNRASPGRPPRRRAGHAARALLRPRLRPRAHPVHRR